MACISLPTAMLIAGGISSAGGVASSVIGANAAKKAAKTQAQAAADAAKLQRDQFDTTQANLSPYLHLGGAAANSLEGLLGLGAGGDPSKGLLAPFNPTMDQLSDTPGYKFALNQGLQATQNSFAAKGLGQSGAAMKGAANYAEGLASTTYQQQFENYWTNKLNMFNSLNGVAQGGQNAALGLGQIGTAAAANAGNFATSGAAATAAGTVGAANAWTSGIGAVTGALGNSAQLLGLNSAGLFGNNRSNEQIPGVNITPNVFGGY